MVSPGFKGHNGLEPCKQRYSYFAVHNENTFPADTSVPLHEISDLRSEFVVG